MSELNKVVHKAMGDILSLGYEDFAVVVNVKDGATGIQLAFATTDEAMDRIEDNQHKKVIASVHPDSEVVIGESNGKG